MKITGMFVLIAVLTGIASAAEKPQIAPPPEPVTIKESEPEKRFDLDFKGGSPRQFIDTVEKAAKIPLNVIVAEEQEGLLLPPLKFRNVTVPQLFEAITLASKKSESRATGPSSYQTFTTIMVSEVQIKSRGPTPFGTSSWKRLHLPLGLYSAAADVPILAVGALKMKDKELLSIIAEDAAEFRAQSLEQTLRVVRRRRRVRRCAQVLATIALFATVLWWNIPRPTPVDRPTTAALEVLITRESSVEIVSSTASSVVIVGDQELLELVPGEKKLLV